jgi:hypothetical protein
MRKPNGLIVIQRMGAMKYLLLTVAFVLCFLPMSAMAGSTQSAKINLSDPVVVSGTHLKPGDYTVRWEGTGPDVQVKFLRNNKEVAAASAKIVDKSNDRPPVLVTNSTSDGSITIKEIGLSKISLTF